MDMGWLQNTVNVLNATELCTKKMVKIINFVLCIFYCNKKGTSKERGDDKKKLKRYMNQMQCVNLFGS